MSHVWEAVVVGTGFGGAINACRLAKRWPGPGTVLVLERGKRYPMGSFPRSPRAFSRNFWNLPEEKRARPGAMRDEEQHGLFDIRNFIRMDAVLAAGLGGGSLIYANVFLEPPDHVLSDPRWPASCHKPALAPYFAVAKAVLGARPIPPATDPRRRIVRTELFQSVARELGRDSRLVDINVFFGNELDRPLPIGEQAKNRYGALQTSCVYCAECDVGCNTHSKNTLDLNYLFVAEKRYRAEVRTEHLVERISPVDARGEDDPAADGSHGYSVTFQDLTQNPRTEQRVLARRVVLSAGTLGSTELLLRAREVHRTLTRLPPRLGQQFSGNGDFLSFVLKGERDADPNYGPVITQRIDFNLFQDFDRERAFILEDASYPAFGAWFSEAFQPRLGWLGPAWHALRETVAQLLKRGRSAGRLGFALADLIGGADLSYKTSVLLCMGIDKSNGRMFLGADRRIDVDWPREDSRPLYDALLGAASRFRERTGGKLIPLPSWFWPFRRNVTVHALGGCVLGTTPEAGVTSADPATFGQVFGYHGLYVADGALLPTAVGANPTATIAALSERVAEGITGLRPDAAL
jgi:cholesterol oxidase